MTRVFWGQVGQPVFDVTEGFKSDVGIVRYILAFSNELFMRQFRRDLRVESLHFVESGFELRSPYDKRASIWHGHYFLENFIDFRVQDGDL